jgi:electron transfer flavoprotein alpha subunit
MILSGFRISRAWRGPASYTFSMSFRPHRVRLTSTLAILEQRDDSLLNGYLNVLGAASQLGGPVCAFIAGAKLDTSVRLLSQAVGVVKVVKVANPLYEQVM